VKIKCNNSKRLVAKIEGLVVRGGGQNRLDVNWAWRIQVASKHLLPQGYEMNRIIR